MVEYSMLHSEALAYRYILGVEPNNPDKPPLELPAYWAITHSWTSNMNLVETPINQVRWPVPVPQSLDIECNLRQELLGYGMDYVWLDVLCLRQGPGANLDTSHTTPGSRREIREAE